MKRNNVPTKIGPRDSKSEIGVGGSSWCHLETILLAQEETGIIIARLPFEGREVCWNRIGDEKKRRG